MKQITTTLAILFISLLGFSQTQFEAMKKIGEGTYRIYEAHGESGNKKYTYDPKDGLMIFKMNNPDDIKRFEISVKWGPGSASKYSFAENVVGYPITFQSGSLKHPKLKYSKIIQSDLRIVVVDDLIYYLRDYKSITDFSLEYVLKKGELNNLQKRKEIYAVLKMNNQGIEQKLLDYLKLEEAKQVEEMQKWTTENPDYAKQLVKDNGGWETLLDESDAEFAKLRATNVTVNNKTSQTIYFGTSHNPSAFELSPGSSKDIPCNTGVCYKSNSSGTKLEKLFIPSNYCGKVYNITSW